MATTTHKSDTATKKKPAPGKSAPGNGGLAVGAAAAGLVAGLAANFVRKAIVQGPTALAGQWDEALAAEHAATLLIFDKLEQTDDGQAAKRTVLLTQLKHALAKHALQEENAVYAALRDHSQTEDADHLNHDHGYVKQFLYDLTILPRGNPAWLGKVREFRVLIERHMHEEETEIFPRMRAALSEQENKDLTIAMNKEGLKIA